MAYSIFALHERGRMFVSHGEAVYEGMISASIRARERSRVNPIKTKKLTNVRAAARPMRWILTPPIDLTLEYAVEFIADDESSKSRRRASASRKRKLLEHERKRASRADTKLFSHDVSRRWRASKGSGVPRRFAPI